MRHVVQNIDHEKIIKPLDAAREITPIVYVERIGNRATLKQRGSVLDKLMRDFYATQRCWVFVLSKNAQKHPRATTDIEVAQTRFDPGKQQVERTNVRTKANLKPVA
jgi:hypothetical protein